MINRQIPPPIHDFDSFELRVPKKIELAHQIPLYVVENQQLNLLNFVIQIEAGKCYEPKKGVASSTYQLLRESAANLTSAEIADVLDSYGAALNVAVNLETVSINLIVPKRNCGNVLPFVFDMLLHPIFTEQKWQILHQQQLKNLEYNAMKNDFRASQLMISSFFEPHSPVGTPLTKELLLAVTLDDIRRYHATTYCAENIKLFVAGNVDESIVAILQPLVEAIPSGKTAEIQSQFVDNQRVNTFEETEEKLQSTFILSQPFFAYSDERARQFSVLATLLGGYFGSRLMQHLRERKGYTYGVGARFLYVQNRSIFYIESAVNAEVSRAAVSACFEEMGILHRELVPAQELQLVKNYMIGQALRSVDGSIQLMNNYAFWLKNGCDETAFNKKLAVIRSMTAEKMQEMAQNYLLESRFSQILVGGEK